MTQERRLIPEALEKALEGRIIYLWEFAAAVLITLTSSEVVGAALFVGFICVLLICCHDTSPTLLPFMLMCVFVTRCHDSYDDFIKYAWMALPVLFSVTFHLVFYKKFRRPLFGKSSTGIAAVAVATAFGGTGIISPKEYFAPSALYHTLGLGAGMLLLYAILRAVYSEKSSYLRIGEAMYISGFFAAFATLRFYAEDIGHLIDSGSIIKFQSSNNLSLFLMLAMPFAAIFARRHTIHILSVPFFYICILLTGSRGGLVMGTTGFFVLLVMLALKDRKNRPIYLSLFAVFFLAAFLLVKRILIFYGMDVSGVEGKFLTVKDLFEIMVSEKESRSQLVGRSIQDFLANPLFGRGIGYRGNEDLYNPVRGAANWYHMWLPQIIGSLGAVGILAYFYQFIQRCFIYFRKPDFTNTVFFMSYISLFLMSQVNPGEFCPLPFSMLAVLYFIIIENRSGDGPDNLKTDDKKTGRKDAQEIFK